MYGIFYDDDEFGPAAPAGLATPPQPVVINDVPPLADHTIPNSEKGPSIVASDNYALTMAPVDTGVAGRNYRRDTAPESLTDAERDERITLLLPLLRTMARVDIDTQIGEMMADVLRRGTERKSARKSANRI